MTAVSTRPGSLGGGSSPGGGSGSPEAQAMAAAATWWQMGAFVPQSQSHSSSSGNNATVGETARPRSRTRKESSPPGSPEVDTAPSRASFTPCDHTADGHAFRITARKAEGSGTGRSLESRPLGVQSCCEGALQFGDWASPPFTALASAPLDEGSARPLRLGVAIGGVRRD